MVGLNIVNGAVQSGQMVSYRLNEFFFIFCNQVFGDGDMVIVDLSGSGIAGQR